MCTNDPSKAPSAPSTLHAEREALELQALYESAVRGEQGEEDGNNDEGGDDEDEDDEDDNSAKDTIDDNSPGQYAHGTTSLW